MNTATELEGIFDLLAVGGEGFTAGGRKIAYVFQCATSPAEMRNIMPSVLRELARSIEQKMMGNAEEEETVFTADETLPIRNDRADELLQDCDDGCEVFIHKKHKVLMRSKALDVEYTDGEDEYVAPEIDADIAATLTNEEAQAIRDL